jgi:crotonobetainyl-CoA:carnitine CoA-transferase CaiB-like acyl-CoA transferase
VPCGPINSIPDAFADEQFKARGMQIELPHPSAGTLPLMKGPIEFRESPSVYERAPPLLGQHSDEVLRELGLGDDEVAALRKGGIV